MSHCPPVSRTSRALVLLAIGALPMLSAASHAQSAPQHLAAARDLVSRVDLTNTSYAHGQGSVDWGTPATSNTDCSGFVDHLLMHTYGYSSADFKRWFDSTRPSARRYYDAIANGEGFVRIDRVQDLKPGDFIAVKYLKRTDNTGHVMVVDQAPVPAPATRAPSGPGTAWAVAVIDSAESGHGTTDTRHRKGADGRDHDGIGEGVLRLYADASGSLLGFSWSTQSVSAFKGPDDEPVVMGRLKPGFKP